MPRLVAKGVWSTAASMLAVERNIFLRESLVELLAEYPDVRKLAAETAPFGESYSEGLYALGIYVQEACYKVGCDIVLFDPSTVKSLLRADKQVVKGRLDKQDSIAGCKADLVTSLRAKVKAPKWNHNEADAYIIARAGAHFWEYREGTLTEDDLTPSEKSTFNKLIDKQDRRFFLWSERTKEKPNAP